MNSRLLELSGLVLFNRAYVAILGFAFLGLALWRFSMTERAPSRWRLSGSPSGRQREATSRSRASAARRRAVVARECQPSLLPQFLTRLRVEVRQVLTSPGLIVLTLLAVTFSGVVLFLAQSSYGTPDHPTVSATITRGHRRLGTLPAADRRLLRRRARVARARPQDERADRQHRRPELGDDGAEDARDLPHPSHRQCRQRAHRHRLCAVEGAREIGLLDYVLWFIVPAAIDGLLIAILAVFVQVLSPNKYVGWGILFVWFVGGIFLRTWAMAIRSIITAAGPIPRSAISSAPAASGKAPRSSSSTGCASPSSSPSSPT